ncbi:MAG: hypothetical protein SFU25_08915 [Candidatus Caenarcaniphilales bacterium]|nr:hypothetical protein [Candidatus Caenarcaniphilales bacterium]
MNLSKVQEFVGEILMKEAGINALDDLETWKEFCKKRHQDSYQGEKVRFGLSQYQELLNYSVNEALLSIYPHTFKFFLDKSIQISEHYRRVFPNKTFQMVYAVEKFPEYLAKHSSGRVGEIINKYPFLIDLATYEWLEVKVQNAPEIVYSDGFHKVPPMLAEAFPLVKPFWNPTLITFKSDFPVSLIINNLTEVNDIQDLDFEITQQTKKSHELIYRDTENFKVKFLSTTNFVFNLLNLSLAKPELTFQELKDESVEFSFVNINEFINLYKSLFDKNLMLGVVE